MRRSRHDRDFRYRALARCTRCSLFATRIALEGAANGDLRDDVSGIKLVKRQLMRPVLFLLNGRLANLTNLVRNEFQNVSLRKVFRTWPLFVSSFRLFGRGTPQRRGASYLCRYAPETVITLTYHL